MGYTDTDDADDLLAMYARAGTNIEDRNHPFRNSWLTGHKTFKDERLNSCCEILLDDSQPPKRQIKEKKMTEHLIDALQTNFTTVKVKYTEKDRQLYTFKVSKDLTLDVGDLVLIQNNTDTFYRTVEVVKVDDVSDIDYNAPFDYKWVVSKVDLKSFKTLLKQEQTLLAEIEIIKKRNKRAEVLSNAGLSQIDIDHLLIIGTSIDK